MADEHLPRIGAPGATPSLTPREPTAFPHWFRVSRKRTTSLHGMDIASGAEGTRSEDVVTTVCRLLELSLALRIGC